MSFPAIAETDELHVVETPFGTKEFRRRAGDALHPERELLETLARIRSNIGEYNFAGQYQQTPAPAGGGMVKEAWFRRYRMSDRPEAFDRIIQSWDTANKPSELADYSVCTTWGLKGPNFPLLNVLRKKLSFPDLKRSVIEQDGLFRPEAILIEDKASGTQLIQDLIEAGLSHVTRYPPDGDKVMRLHAQTATIENGFVHLPEEAHWLADYLSELTMFPAARYDDQVDFDRPGSRMEQAANAGVGHHRVLPAGKRTTEGPAARTESAAHCARGHHPRLRPLRASVPGARAHRRGRRRRRAATPARRVPDNRLVHRFRNSNHILPMELQQFAAEGPRRQREVSRNRCTSWRKKPSGSLRKFVLSAAYRSLNPLRSHAPASALEESKRESLWGGCR